MLALRTEQSETLFSLQHRRSKRLALMMMLGVCGCATRPNLSSSEAAEGAPASEPAAVPAPASAPLASIAAPPLGLIEQVPPGYSLPAANVGNVPVVPQGRVATSFASHLQIAPAADPVSAEALPAPTPIAAPALPTTEAITAPAGQAHNPPVNQPITQPASPPPGDDRWLRLPAASEGLDSVQLSTASDLVSLTARDAPLNTVLAMIAEQHGLNIVTGADVTELISVKITNARLEDALDAILATNGYTWARRSNIIIVSKISGDNKVSAATQGRLVQVFNLDYMSATDADKVVQGLLSPVGQSVITATMPTDHRRTHEQLVVEDLPEYLHRIEQYLLQADTPPRQVQIEAHVLQVTLKDNCRHGVNFSEILHIAHADVNVSTVGLASSTAPTSMIRIQGGDLDSLLEALKSTTDAKTLASPKVTVLNNQEAHMQVGAKIGYLLSTTTQTSTLQSVNFLDVGVILTVLPSITADGQVLIRVAPQVSTGRINPTTQLPESETTEVETRVLLADGEAIVIGGLIKETDNDGRSKVPILGDLWLVGWLFQRREVTRERNEIIITLVPRIVPDSPGCRALEPEDVQQAHTPLLYGSLQEVDRTRFEPQLPCYSVRPRDRQDSVPPQPMLPAQPYVPAHESLQPEEIITYPVVTEPAGMPNLSDQPPVEMALPSQIRPFREP